MKLLLDEDLLKLRAQDPYDPIGPGKELTAEELLVLVKFFTPDSNWTWYAVSASKDPDSDAVQFFGLVKGLETELGYFWLWELEEVRGPWGLKVERDMYWTPIPLSEVTRIVDEVGYV